MLTSELARRQGGARTLLFIAAIALAGGLTACATETAVLDYTPPTMAPEQNIDEACQLAGEEVDRITLEAEAQIKQGIDQAAADLGAGKMPSFDFFPGTIDEALADVQEQILNPEVSSALLDVRRSVQGFGEIERPDSALGVPAYLSALTSELKDLVAAGNNLQSLCGITQ